MNRQLRWIISTLMFVAAAATVGAYSFARSQKYALLEVCNLIEKNYFRANDAEVMDFLSGCEQGAEDHPLTFSTEDQITRINSFLSQFQVSHLSVYAPEENAAIWEREDRETGIRARMIDGKLVVFEILPSSPAELAGLQVGDVLINSGGEAINHEFAARTISGFTLIERRGKRLSVILHLEKIVEDMTPTLKRLSPKTAVLRLKSFLPDLYEKESWEKIAMKLDDYENLIIDLRDNMGGSFPAMLRALSPFLCEKQEIGRIWRATRDGEERSEIPLTDELSAVEQLRLLEASTDIVLRAFDDYGCFDGKITVLVDNGTSSTAEVFAQSFMNHPQARVWGHPTAGQVVMARWFPLKSFGPGDYAIAIPIAGYRAANGEEIENFGVIPHKEIHYDLETALKGEDSWIKQALAP